MTRPASAAAAQACVGIAIGLAVLLALGRMSAFSATSPARQSQANASAGPVISVDTRQCDLGTIPPGSSAQAVFHVRNLGDARLILRKSNGACDCTSPREAPLIIEPGRSGKVTANLNARSTPGPLRVELHFLTNDPRRPRLSLSCMADVSAR